MAPKAKKIYNQIKKQEKKIAKKEVKKAKKMIHKKKKWTVAASALGYHVGYSSKKGFIGGKGGLTEKLQGGVEAKQIPASNSTIFTPYYTRKALKNGLMVCGLQKVATVCVSNANTTWCINLNGTKVTSIRLNPDNIGGSMAFDARNYQFFKFKKIRFIFVMPSTAGSADSATFTNVSVAFAHFTDSEIGAFQTIDYAALQNSNDMFEFQVVQPFGPVIWHPKQLGTSQVKWFSTEMDTAPTDAGTRAESRFCCQGIIYGFYDQALAASSGTLTKVGDILMEYELALKERSPDYGFTLQIGDRQLLKDVRDTIKLRFDKDQKDMKTPEDRKNPNVYMKKFNSTMQHLDRILKTEVKSQIGPPIVAIADPSYNGSDATKLVTVSGGALACGSGSGVQSVNVSQINGNSVDSTGAGLGLLPVVVKTAGASGGGYLSVGGGAIQANITQIGSTSVDNGAASLGLMPTAIKTSSGAGTSYLSITGNTMPVDLYKVNSVAINTDGKTPSASVPVNINAVNQATLVNTSNPNNGASLNSAIPVQMFGVDSTGNSGAVTAYVSSGSGTSAGVRHATSTGTTTAITDTIAGVRSSSPTPSLNEEYVKIPKSALKDADKKQKGPKGPSTDYDSDEERKIIQEIARSELRRLGFEDDPDIDFSQKQCNPVKELARQVITDTFTEMINQD